MTLKTTLLTLCAASCFTAAAADGVPVPVSVGAGSYASCPPAYKSRTADRGGSWASYIESMKLYADETNPDGTQRPIPTNDWWTDLMVNRYADALWSYPQMLKPGANGVAVHYPTYWIDNGTEIKSRSHLTVSAADFTADCARATDWHDWDVVMTLPGKEQGAIKVTMAHGMPFSWFEYTDLQPTVSFSAAATYFDGDGRELSPQAVTATPRECLGVKIGNDLYGLYLPPKSQLDLNDGVLTILADGPAYLAVGLLRSTSDLAPMADYAYSVPRSTTVDWHYDTRSSTMHTAWQVNAVSLRGAAQAPVLQGFLPHVYKHASATDFAYTGAEYLTPRGRLRMATAAGNRFEYSRRFSGMLPHYAAPAKDGLKDPGFRPERLDSLITDYANRGTFGADTYWGGKGLVQMALNMTFALESGNTAVAELSRRRLRDVLADWLTYTPGEDRYFLAYYPRWGSLVGYDYSYDSDRFNDHHFHYGYFIYAGALLCMHDADFRAAYGPMLRELAKDIANYDRTDTRYPYLRTLDPWTGHSYAGGLGDGLNDNGNGQESSSEAMQSWGGIYLLGVALGDDALRDAGLFGWLTESAATAEYWFDRDHIRGSGQGNYDYTLYKHPYNTNITCKGIGWWTWFSGDPLWMHSIQWMPVSPCLNYLSQDLEFAKWDYDTFRQGTAYSWFNDGTSTEAPLADQSVGNVVLCYLERHDPAQAAAIFDRAYDQGYGMARNIDTGHISYFVTHSHLRWGDPDFSVRADLPTAQAFRAKDGTVTYMAYNPTDSERSITFTHADGTARSFRLPISKRIVCFRDDATPAAVAIDCPAYIAPGQSARVSARVLDCYGATVPDAAVTFSVTDGPATISGDTLLIAADAAAGSSVTLTAAFGDIQGTVNITTNAAPRVVQAVITPVPDFVEQGNSLSFTATAIDQYGNPWSAQPRWSIVKDEPTMHHGETPWLPVAMASRRGAAAATDLTATATDLTATATDLTAAATDLTAAGSDFTAAKPGRYTVTAQYADTAVSHSFVVTPPLPNIALHRPVTVSSVENVGTVAANATDGDSGTRWGSAHTDNEWIAVDLGSDCRITGTEILWETAHASSYRIEVAAEAAPDSWQTVLEVPSLTRAGADRRVLSTCGRYVRMTGLGRATPYGYSMFEFRVFGIPADADMDAVAGIEIEVPAMVAEHSSVPVAAYGWNLRGQRTADPVSWSADMPGVSFADGVMTTAEPGQLTLTAQIPVATASRRGTAADANFNLHHGEAPWPPAANAAQKSVTATATINVCETIKLHHAAFSPAACTTIEGVEQPLSLDLYNQFDGLWREASLPECSVSLLDADDNVIETNPDCAVYNPLTGVFCASRAGRYAVEAMGARAVVTVMALADANIALGKPATATSVYGGNTAAMATDGLLNTRWESAWADDQSLTVDLRKSYALTKVRIHWEGAFATAYALLLSADGRTWTEVYSTDSGRGGVETVTLTPHPARYLRVRCDRRGTVYGNSIYELEAYAAPSNTSSVPDITVDADDRGPEIYDLQGRPCNSAKLIPGIYLRRRGQAFDKVVVR